MPLGDPASRSPGDWLERLGTTLRPLTKLTYAAESALGFGEFAPARRATSVAIHAISAFLLTLILARLFEAGGAGAASPTPWPAISAAALVWSLHPIHAESLLAVAGRSAALSGALLLGALLAHLHGKRTAAALLLLGAALARETALAGVAVLAAAELAMSDRGAAPAPVRFRLSRLLPAFLAAVLAAGWIATVPRYRALADFSFAGRPWAASVIDQVASIPRGLELYVRVDRLSLDHGRPPARGAGDPEFLLGLGILLGAAAGAVLAARRSPLAGVGLALWLAAIVPTQTVVPRLDPLTERPLGLALAGVLLAAAGAATAFLRLRGRPLAARAATAAACILIAAALASATLARGRLYASDVALWADAASKSRSNPRPHINLAVALLEAGRPDEARAAFRAALDIDPFDAQAARAWESLARKEGS